MWTLRIYRRGLQPPAFDVILDRRITATRHVKNRRINSRLNYAKSACADSYLSSKRNWSVLSPTRPVYPSALAHYRTSRQLWKKSIVTKEIEGRTLRYAFHVCLA